MRLQVTCVYGDPRRWFSRFIMIFQKKHLPETRYKLTHVAHSFIPETPEEAMLPFANKMFESVAPFARATDISEWYRKKKRWRIHEYLGNKEKIIAYGWWSQGTKGCDAYDWRGAFSFPLRFITQNKHKDFCSEYQIRGQRDTGILPTLMSSFHTPSWLDAYYSELPEWKVAIHP